MQFDLLDIDRERTTTLKFIYIKCECTMYNAQHGGCKTNKTKVTK